MNQRISELENSQEGLEISKASTSQNLLKGKEKIFDIPETSKN